MNFKPKSDDELNTFDLFPTGEYDFDVIKAIDDTSKAGNDMIKLELDVYATNGKRTRVFDYLLESLSYKLKHFCEATGLAKEYESGDLSAEMCKNRAGRCVLGIQKDKSGEYPDKNFVKDYCKQTSTHPTPQDGMPDFSDVEEKDIPY